IALACRQHNAAGVLRDATNRESIGACLGSNSAPVSRAPLQTSAVPSALRGDLPLVGRCIVRAQEKNGVIVRGDVEGVKTGSGRLEEAADTPDKIVMPAGVVNAE